MIFRFEAALHQSLRHFESDSSAAELFVRIIAAVLIRIDYRQGLGNAILARQVMVRHDEIDAETLRGFRRAKGANAHINADDEANACGRGALDDIVTHVIAFADAMWNVEVGGASAEFNRCFEDDYCHRAIDVVVAVDQHRLFALDGGIKTIDSGPQAAHPLGGVEVIKRGAKKTLRGFSIADAAARKQRT